jgi:hypothetical protein
MFHNLIVTDSLCRACSTKGQADVIGQLVTDNDREKKPVQRMCWDRAGECTGHKLMQELRAKGCCDPWADPVDTG